MAKWSSAHPVGTVALVDAPVSRHYGRRAWVAFVGTSFVAGLLAVAAFSAVEPLPVAVLLAVPAGVVCGLAVAAVVWAWPVLRVVWWWSAELAAVAVLVTTLVAVSRTMSSLFALTVLAVVGAVVGSVGRVRRRVVAWGWCVVVRHRLRLCFAEVVRTGGRSRPGGLPLMLWARPTPAGERVWVWLRPGLGLEDLEGRTDRLAVACWAGEVRVVRASARFAALIRVDTTRRDPLAAVVASPLTAWYPAGEPDRSGPDAVVPSGLNLADVPEPAEMFERRSR